MPSILRYDEATSDWVIFAPSRSRRPDEFRRGKATRVSDSEPPTACPFCPGNESLAPHELYADRPPGGSSRDWLVRVIPNKFPALRIEENERRHDESDGFRSLGGYGAHEVIVESHDHHRVLCEQPVEQIERVLRAVQSRHQDLMQDPRIQTVIIFKNHGEGAGTSLRHPHWQLIATPVVPRMLRQKHQVATDHFDRTGDCLYCVLLQRELSTGHRVLTTNDDFVAVLPYASHVPFETWILPRRHLSSFAMHPGESLRQLAELLQTVLRKLHRGLDNPDFNLTIDTVARGDEVKSYFLWHMRILPRLTTPAGFELGSGMSINTVLPEEAAAYLREIDITK